jgi:hypothetical protein
MGLPVSKRVTLESLAAGSGSKSAAAVSDSSHLKFKLGGWPGPQGGRSKPASASPAGTVGPAGPGHDARPEPGPEAVTLLPVLTVGAAWP